jgi:hypothetical protein
MRRSLLIWAVVLVAAALSACAGQRPPASGGSPSVAVPGAPGTYRASGTVLESPEHGPQLCNMVQESLPPQCGGIDLVGWDWAAADGEESVNGTTWGSYQVTGTWDGSRLTLTEPPAEPVYDSSFMADFGTPCPEPPGGWQVIDPSLTNDDALNDAVIAANERDDFAGLWLDQPIRGTISEATANDPTNLVLNVRVTGDVAVAEADLRATWGGALCVTRAEHTEAELTAIQNEISRDAAAIRMSSSSVDSVTGTIEVMVVIDDGSLQATYDVRYGPGLVRVTSWLQPAD